MAADTSAAPAEDTAAEEDAAVDSGAGYPKPISVALLLGYGIGMGTGNVNPFGLGFGVRGGYNIDEIYVGARFGFFLGESVDVAGAESSTNVMQIGVEGGYDLDLGGFVVRPEVGLGLMVANAESTVTIFGMTQTIDASSTDLFLSLGAAGLYNISDSIFVGVDISLPIVFASGGYQGLELMATGGMRF